jgi:hypothetical protein
MELIRNFSVTGHTGISSKIMDECMHLVADRSNWWANLPAPAIAAAFAALVKPFRADVGSASVHLVTCAAQVHLVAVSVLKLFLGIRMYRDVWAGGLGQVPILNLALGEIGKVVGRVNARTDCAAVIDIVRCSLVSVWALPGIGPHAQSLYDDMSSMMEGLVLPVGIVDGTHGSVVWREVATAGTEPSAYQKMLDAAVQAQSKPRPVLKQLQSRERARIAALMTKLPQRPCKYRSLAPAVHNAMMASTGPFFGKMNDSHIGWANAIVVTATTKPTTEDFYRVGGYCITCLPDNMPRKRAMRYAVANVLCEIWTECRLSNKDGPGSLRCGKVFMTARAAAITIASANGQPVTAKNLGKAGRITKDKSGYIYQPTYRAGPAPISSMQHAAGVLHRWCCRIDDARVAKFRKDAAAKRARKSGQVQMPTAPRARVGVQAIGAQTRSPRISAVAGNVPAYIATTQVGGLGIVGSVAAAVTPPKPKTRIRRGRERCCRGGHIPSADGCDQCDEEWVMNGGKVHPDEKEMSWL